jgi:hypothetical protein
MINLILFYLTKIIFIIILFHLFIQTIQTIKNINNLNIIQISSVDLLIRDQQEESLYLKQRPPPNV